MAHGHLVLEAIPIDECRDLLASHSYGRIAVVTDRGPLILPVNYVFDADRVVFRTDPGTKLDASEMRRVAFEIDGGELDLAMSWSVVVQGVAAEVTDALDRRSEALRSLPVRPVAPGAKEHYVQIVADVITGRRLRS